jgi:hypothetical protein
MKRYQLRSITEIRQQRRHIATTDEDFGIGADQVKIEVRQKVIAAVAPARAENRFDLRASEHLMQLVHTPLNRSGKVQFALENGREIKRLISQPQQLRATSFEIVATKTAGRGNDAHRITGPESSGTSSLGLIGRSHADRLS